MSGCGETSSKGLALATAVACIVLLTFAPGRAVAQDARTGLAQAEEQVAQAEGELLPLQGRVAAAEGRYRAAARDAAPSLGAWQRGKVEVRQLQRHLAAQEQRAKAHIAQLNEQHQQEVDDHDEQVRSGVGFGLAALVAGFIALVWGWFRATAPVAALTELDLGRAVGICVGGGFLLLIVGAVLGSSNGVAGALGSFLFCLGLILPTAFLLARHSAEVQRGRSKPLLRRNRLPSWVPMGTAALMFVLFLASTGSAIFASGASSEPISAQLEEEAEATSAGDGAQELARARGELARAKQRAAAPVSQRNEAPRLLAKARRELGHAQHRLAAARSSESSFTRRVVVLEAREQREREQEEARLRREAEQQREIEAEEQEEAEEELASECDPNYSGCLDPYSPDYDCLGGSGDGPDYTGTVTVLGEDHYGLDSDGDGIGCE